MNGKLLGRRPVVAGLLGMLGLGAGGGLLYGVRLLRRRRYPPTSFDDLLAQLPDRDAAATLGAAVLAETPRFDPEAAARQLRWNLAGKPLARGVEKDVGDGRLQAVQGWLLPASLAETAAIAASVQRPSPGP